MNRAAILAAVVCAAVATGQALGQSLYERRPKKPTPMLPGTGTGSEPETMTVAPSDAPEEAAGNGTASSAAPTLEDVGLAVVKPPSPRRYAKHDLVEVIVNESSVQEFKQTLDAKKKYDLMAELSNFPSLKRLLEGQITNGPPSDMLPAKLGLDSDNKFKGEGKYSSNDKFTARITAEVVDVKPNGNLVLEAREIRQSDKEILTMVLAGVCRAEDISKNNTLQSSQLAGLTLKVEHEGQVKDTAQKGLIPRVLEAIFNF